MTELKFKIANMTCVNCSNAIEKVCSKIDGVKDVSVSYLNSSGVFLVENENLKNKIEEKIKALGFEILEDEQNLQLYKISQLKKLKNMFFLSMILSAIIMYFEMFIQNTLSSFVQLALSFVAIFYCGKSFFSHAIKGLWHKNLDMNTLVSLGALVSFVYSFLVYVEIFSKDGYLYFSSGAMIISFILLGKYLEENAKFKSLEYQNKLKSIDVKYAHIILEDGSVKEISSSFVKKDDLIMVKEGESVVADGFVVNGEAEVDVSFLTGEFLPLIKKEGDEILAGSILLNGNLKIRASKKSIESSLEQIKNLVSKAGSIKTPLTNLANKISAYFVAFIILLAVCVFVFWYFAQGINVAFLHACATLLISCPCALGLATPIAIISALSNGAKNSILVKNPAILENLYSIKLAIFDKTGTLTKDELSVYRHNLSSNDFEKLAQIEKLSSHPIAQAISKNLNTNLNLTGKLSVMIGNGLSYIENDDEYFIANEKFFKYKNIDISKSKEFLKEFKQQAPTTLYFVKNKICLGGVCLANELKPMAKEMINNLADKNIKSIILSGDNEASVSKIAKELGIKEYYANLNPEEKLDFIKERLQQEKVLFVGDGINDAPALILSSASISFSKASNLAKKSGDFILIKDDLMLIDYCFKLSKKTRNIIKLNLFWAFIYNILCIPIAAGFVSFISLSPHLAALAMCFSSITVILNSLRIR
ncbi:heavy metal translocating P-type ATPase [Campylobacter insulaenigrae]|uniref:heavy metal translocating P-type ATPase n=1 Tax=Campylobacter insulaenigrae TaxID=260714 RepID=UPI00215311C2|nr:cation-translocating P-type ATPase [Campylobacter insulaenigrae]MCR6571614.1 cation-translocating P-type ATPase [Campylobacter insulaenigrae]MCR6574590.1 cation-translocating P-type ATPase [Campylobacter insulaenigrae]MCR6580799.1 cation-translocating P-type ATPase [Campylobacter insulaenigrae]MCR6582334.1 cation-translocating P-type ATPase [Campylobacter insulaenigrae]MCR6586913.1 cation-translocating P-type ATPase [Campylobacter insulaenigrae]